MFLVISEKPSVAQALARVLGAGKKADGYLKGPDCIVSWCLGHLAEYALPEAYDPKYEKWEFADLPIIPEEWKLAVAKDKKGQLAVLKKLLNRSGFDYVVNACDAGREGELIFRHVYDLAGSRIPVKRLWISSMEDNAIREGFARLKDGREYENLCEASVCRAKADWLVGLNATRAFTSIYKKRLSVGRVQTPTLAMLVERQGAIDRFVKEAYYKVVVEGDGIRAVSEPMKEEMDSFALAKQCDGRTAVVSRVNKTQKKKNPPKLYDLTILQREANRFFGYTAQETLQELQKLYEARLVTYPRTDSQYITEDMGQTVMELLELLPEMLPFLPEGSVGRNIGRITDNKKVADHHALLPTREAANRGLSGLSEKQQNIFRLICQRLAQAVSEECVYEETDAVVTCGGHEFTVKGKAMIRSGFTLIEEAFLNLTQKRGSLDPADDVPAIPEGFCEGMEIVNIMAESTRHFTSPPRAYSEDTLLAAMEQAGRGKFEEGTEKKGLGTPATRAAIIEKLVSSGYARRSGKQILPTEAGMELIAVLPEYLKSAAMTAEWENKLLLMEKGQLDSREFLQGIRDLIDQMLEECSIVPEAERRQFLQKFDRNRKKPGRKRETGRRT